MDSDDDYDDPWSLDASDDEDSMYGDRDDREDSHGAQHVLVLIDCRPSMFEPSIPDQDGEVISPMQASLKACEEILRNKVKHVAVQKTGKRDGVGIMLYGIPKDNHTTQILVSMEPPGIQQILKIRNLLDTKGSLQEEYGVGIKEVDGSGLSPLRIALHNADGAFNQAKCVKQATPGKTLPDAKSVWIFTNDDDPLGGNEEERTKVAKAANDAIENGVELHVWPMKTPFRGDFYDSILSAPVEAAQEEALFDMEALMDRIKRDFRKMRTAFSCPMLLPDWRSRPDDPGIQIDFYRTVQLQSKPQPVWIHQETKKLTERVTQWLDETTNDILKTSLDTKEEAKARSEKHPIRLVTQFGGKTVEVKKDEVVDIKKQSNANQEQSSLILLGFKPKDSLPVHYTMEKSFYMYPNEYKVKGSTAAFANLHAAMLRKGVLAIGELLTRATATSRLVAIFPQQGEYLAEEEGGEQITPPGMVAVVLPFEDDVRALELDSGSATEASVQAAAQVIDRMKFGEDFALDYFKNDSLVHFYTYMESIALETTLPTPEQSLNQISDDDVREQAGDVIDAFVASLPEDIILEKESKKRKRVPDESGCDWVDLYKTDALNECTLTMLKQYLKSVGEKIGGKKAELIERVSQSIVDRIKSEELQDV